MARGKKKKKKSINLIRSDEDMETGVGWESEGCRLRKAVDYQVLCKLPSTF